MHSRGATVQFKFKLLLNVSSAVSDHCGLKNKPVHFGEIPTTPGSSDLPGLDPALPSFSAVLIPST